MSPPQAPPPVLPPALVARFAARLPARLDELLRLLSAVVVDDEGAARDSAALDAARTAAHHLRGTSSTYGFTEVGQAAAEVDDVLFAALKGEALTEQVLVECRALVQAAKEESFPT